MEELINSFEGGKEKFENCIYFNNVIMNLTAGATEKQVIIALINIIKESDAELIKIINYSKKNNSFNENTI